MIGNPRYPYSPREAALLRALRGGGRRTTTDLIDRVYGREAPPLNARQALLVVVAGLRSKMTRNGEEVRVRKGRRRGSIPIEIWLDKTPAADGDDDGE